MSTLGTALKLAALTERVEKLEASAAKRGDVELVGDGLTDDTAAVQRAVDAIGSASAAADEPACPGCGMTARVAPSRKEPGRWMCHGCARLFDVAAADEPGEHRDDAAQ